MINNEWERFKSKIREAECIKTVTDAHVLFLESIAKYVDDTRVVSRITAVYQFATNKNL